MSGINKVILLGRLGKDPEVKEAGQTQVCRFSIATSETYKKDGESKEKTEWHNITAWGKLAEICGKYLKKGKQVYVEGKLQTRTWEDQEGKKRYSTDIVASTVQFLGDSSGSVGEENSSPDFDASGEIPF